MKYIKRIKCLIYGHVRYSKWENRGNKVMGISVVERDLYDKCKRCGKDLTK